MKLSRNYKDVTNGSSMIKRHAHFWNGNVLHLMFRITTLQVWDINTLPFIHIHIHNPANSDDSDFSDQISDFSDSPNIPIFPMIIGESEKSEI